MARDQLDRVILAELLLPPRDSQVTDPPLLLRQRFVRHPPDQVAQELVLPVLGRQPIRLDAEQLLPEQGGEDRVRLLGWRAVHGDDRIPCEGLAEDGRVLDQSPLRRLQPVEACGDQPVEAFGDLELLDRGGGAEPTVSWVIWPRSSSIRIVSTA